MARRPVGKKLNAVERQQMMSQAVELAARGLNFNEIGDRIGTSRQTAHKLMQDELARRDEHETGHERQKAIATYTALIREGWIRLERLKDQSLNVSGVLNSIRAAQERIDKLTGAEAPVRFADETQTEIEVVWDDVEIPREANVES